MGISPALILSMENRPTMETNISHPWNRNIILQTLRSIDSIGLSCFQGECIFKIDVFHGFSTWISHAVCLEETTINVKANFTCLEISRGAGCLRKSSTKAFTTSCLSWMRRYLRMEDDIKLPCLSFFCSQCRIRFQKALEKTRPDYDSFKQKTRTTTSSVASPASIRHMGQLPWLSMENISTPSTCNLYGVG